MIYAEGNMPQDIRKKVDSLLNEFEEIVENISRDKKIRRAVVRSRLPCNIIALLDAKNLYIMAQHHHSMSTTTSYIYDPNIKLTPEQAIDISRFDFGFHDPFLIKFPASLLDQSREDRQKSLSAIALTHIESEIQRFIKMTSLIQINPIFGPASYSIDKQLVFVLMPFDDELTTIYKTIIKPAVESMGMVCRRADDYKTNRAIIQDIWKGICEARLIIADLTNLNPNVMYELGIAHTVGKETIMIYQKNKEEIKFPFDIVHIRRIEYENTATGGKKLEQDIKETITSILEPTTISQNFSKY
jgi:hypothetical protein